MLVVKPQGARIIPLRNLDGLGDDDSDDDIGMSVSQANIDVNASVDSADVSSLMAVPGGQTAIPVAQALQQQEAILWSSYQMLAQLATSMPDAQIPSAAVDDYMLARNSFVSAAQDWVAAHQQASAANPSQVQDAGAAPIYPPSLSAGIPAGANVAVPISQISVSYGYSGSEQTTSLADTQVWAFSPQARGAAGSGLGIGVLAAVVIAALIIGAIVVAYFAASAASTQAQAKTAQVQAQTNAFQANIQAYTAAIQACAALQGSDRSNCIAAAAKAEAATASSIFQTESSGGLFSGLFGTVGMLVIFGGVLFVGYKVYQQYKIDHAPKKALPGPSPMKALPETSSASLPAAFGKRRSRRSRRR